MVVQHSARTLARDAALLLVAVGLLYWFQAELVQRGFMSGDNPKDTLIWIVIGLVSLVAVFAAVFVFEALLFAPRSLWREAKGEAVTLTQRVAALEQRLIPQMRVSIPDRGVTSLATGHTSETIAGNRQTVMTGERQYVAVHCTNTSASVIRPCGARLVKAWRVAPDGGLTDLGVVESVDLPWTRDDSERFTVFRAGETKSLYVAVLHPSGPMALVKRTSEYPLEYHQLFSEVGHYRLRIQIDGGADDDLALSFLLDIETEEAPMVPNRLPIARAKVAILDQGAPPQSP